MKITILGARVIGATLGRKWAAAGHSLVYGVRNLESPISQALAQELGAQLTPTPEAIAFGEVGVFAIPGDAMASVIQDNGALLAGKIAIDTANKRLGGAMNSLGDFAANAPQALYFRAFNNLGWENFAEPLFGDIPADLLYCGPAGPTQKVVEQLIREIGLNPVWVGDASQVDLVDALARLWFALALGQNLGRRLAFKVLRD